MAGVSKRPASFKLEFPGNESEKNNLKDKISRVRDHLKDLQGSGQRVTNYQIFDTALQHWIDTKIEQEKQVPPKTFDNKAKQLLCDEDIFLTTRSSVKTLLDMTRHHTKYCDRWLNVIKNVQKGHASIVILQCAKKHRYHWHSSPKLPNNDYLVNKRMFHGYTFSGMRPSHYNRMCEGANIGKLSKRARKSLLKKHSPHISKCYEDSIETALLEEVAMYNIEEEEDLGEPPKKRPKLEQSDVIKISNDYHGIDIVTDARHGWRKNAKDTSVVAVGERSKKVLIHVHVTKKDDRVTQRHETLGTKKIYEYLDSKATSVRVHSHDFFGPVNKMVKKMKLTINQNDKWHGVKKIRKKMDNISSGPKYKQGKTWHWQLEDKTDPVVTHVFWAIKNCQGDPKKLTASLDNITKHYKGIHTKCDAKSRCKTDPKYEPKRIVITDKKAAKMLSNAITSSTLYKNPKNFVLGKETFLVESFNNTLNMFQDKRIVYGDEQYDLRSKISVMHWNENVNRPYTSIKTIKSSSKSRPGTTHKNYKPSTYNYRSNVWKSYLKSIY